MSIGKNISKYRKAHGLTQEELGSRLGVTNQAVSKWESEVSMPDVMLLPKIISVLNISFEELYDIEKQATALPKHSEEFYGNANKTLISLLYDHIGHLIVFPEIQIERDPELYEKEKNPIILLVSISHLVHLTHVTIEFFAKRTRPVPCSFIIYHLDL